MFYFGNNLLYNIRVVNNYYDRKENEMETLNEMVEHQNAYGVADGEDGGAMIQTLKELVLNKKEGLIQTEYVDLGTVKHMYEYNQDPDCGSSRLELFVFENGIYRIVCIEDTEVNPSPGGTCYFGSLQIFKIGE